MCRWIGSRVESPCTRARRRNVESGFTLLEVLVAFAVLAVMIVPILQVFGGGLGTAETARAYSTATLLARSKLAEVGMGEPLAEGETTGDFNIPGYHWRQTIARNESEVMPTETDELGDLQASGEAGRSGRRKLRRESRASGDQRSERFAGSGLGERRDRVGQAESGISRRQSERGDTPETLTRRDSERSRTSSSSARRFGRSDDVAGRETDAGGPQSDDMIAYDVTVTVEWDNLRGGGAVRLSTLRLGRRASNLGAEE